MARRRIDYVLELGQARCQQILNEKRASATTNSTDCFLFSGSRNNDGYGQIFTKSNANLNRTGRSAQSAYLLHRVAFVASNGIDVVHHGSHLCDKPRCFNPAHIVDETAVVNNSRKGCAGLLACGFHHHIICDLCPHTPRCIRPERFDISCCLALKESDPVGWETQSSRNDVASARLSTQPPILNMPSSRGGSRDSQATDSPPPGWWDSQRASQPPRTPQRRTASQSHPPSGSLPSRASRTPSRLPPVSPSPARRRPDVISIKDSQEDDLE